MSDPQVKTKMNAATDRFIALAVDDGTTEDADNRFELQADGKQEWGNGTDAPDTNLYRSAANTLKTDDALTVAGLLTATGGVTMGSGYTRKIEAIAFGATELGGSETNTSFTFTANTIVLGAWINVADAEAGGTMDVGTQGTSNDPDGLLDAISLAVTGIIMPAPVTTAGLNETYISSMTFGALIYKLYVGSDEAGEKGSVAYSPTVITAADPVSITSSGDLNSCSGTLYLDLLVPAA